MVLSYFNYLQKVQKGLWKGTHSLSTARKSMCWCLAPTNTHFTHKQLISCAEQEGLWACKEQLCRGFNVLLPRRSQLRPSHPLDCKIMIEKVWQLSCEGWHWLWVGFKRGCITCLRCRHLEELPVTSGGVCKCSVSLDQRIFVLG